jgi:hypothetical protein
MKKERRGEWMGEREERGDLKKGRVSYWPTIQIMLALAAGSSSDSRFSHNVLMIDSYLTECYKGVKRCSRVSRKCWREGRAYMIAFEIYELCNASHRCQKRQVKTSVHMKTIQAMNQLSADQHEMKTSSNSCR